MLPNFASLPRYGTRLLGQQRRSLGPDDSLTHCVLSLRVAGPRGAPRDAKEAGAKVYPGSHFPCGPGVPHEPSEDSSREAKSLEKPPRTRTELVALPETAPLNRAAGTPRAATDSRSVTTTPRRRRRVAHSCPGRLAARSIGCLYSTQPHRGLDSATPWRTPWPCSNRRRP